MFGTVVTAVLAQDNTMVSRRTRRGGLHVVPTDKLLIDPYAKKISRAIKWDARQYEHDSQFMIPKCIVIDQNDYAPSHVSAPVIPKHKRVVYGNIKGLTKLIPMYLKNTVANLSVLPIRVSSSISKH